MSRRVASFEWSEHVKSLRAIPHDQLPDEAARRELMRRAAAGQDVYAYRPASSKHFVVWVRQPHAFLESRFVPMEWAKLWHAGLQPDGMESRGSTVIDIRAGDHVTAEGKRITVIDADLVRRSNQITVPLKENPRGRIRRWWQRLLLLFAALALFVVPLAGCDGGPSSTNASNASPAITPPPTVAHRGPLLIQLDPDITGSYPRYLLLSFLQQMANWIDTIPRMASEPSTVYVTYISHAPYLPVNSPMSFTIAGLPDWPSTGQTPVPQCPDNPYSCSDKQATITTQNASAAVTFQQQMKSVQAQLAAVQQATHQKTQALRALRPGVDNQATSVWGVLNMASQRFSGVSGDKWLILATDLDNNTNIDEIAPDLTGVHVLTLDLYCTSAVQCQKTKSTWTRILQQAHVASVRFLEPEESQTAASPWS